MKTTLTLDLPWLPEHQNDLPEVTVRRGPDHRLSYDDGVELAVEVIVADADDSVDGVLRHIEQRSGPGKVVLLAGPVPVAWRASLRKHEVSWLATDGRAELHWPRLRVSAHRLSATDPPPERNRAPVPLQKRQGVVAQELCTLALANRLPVTVSGLAKAAEVEVAVASSAVESLARHGYVRKERDGNSILVHVDDLSELARLLAARTGWKRAKVIWAYGYGRSLTDVAARVSRAAEDAGVAAAVSGRVGATFLGIVGTGEPSLLRLRVLTTAPEAPRALEQLGLEPVDREEANVAVALDRWGLGTTHARRQSFQKRSAVVAAPMRVWCDLDGEPRGTEFAAQLWEGMMNHGR